MSRELLKRARLVAERLADTRSQLVLAESCTGGLVAASLAAIPGISNWLCGSAVTYQNATKERWLAVPASVLDSPGPVSSVTARLMAEGALQATPHATLAASVTGHLGPDAPPRLDGLIFVGLSRRKGHEADGYTTNVRRFRLPPASRRTRQQAAARMVLDALLKHLHNRGA